MPSDSSYPDSGVFAASEFTHTIQVNFIALPSLEAEHRQSASRRILGNHVWRLQAPLSRLSILPVKRGKNVYCVPIRSADAETARRFAPSGDELTAWATNDNLSWWGAPRDAEFWTTCGMSVPAAGFWIELRAHLRKSTIKVARFWKIPILTASSAAIARNERLEFHPERGDPDVIRRRAMIALGARDPELTPWFHKIESEGGNPAEFPPYNDDPPQPRALLDLSPRRRSVAFIIPSYYNFLYLSKALRARGWDAISISPYDPNGPMAKFGHGEDLNLFNPDPEQQRIAIRDAYRMIIERFGILHFYGVGALGLFPFSWDVTPEHNVVPWDILEAKRRGIKIAYSHTGCMDAVSQSSFRRWSSDMCGSCPWESEPEICSDSRNLSWGWKVSTLADLICAETEVLLDYKAGPNVYREPLTFAVEPDVWRPDVDASSLAYKRERPDEVLIYHAVGNYEARLRDGRNVKGTPAVVHAIERLRSEGHAVSLMRFDELPSRQNMLMLAQADIIVDQLKYGRYGATAREGMMLGKPVVGRINRDEPIGPASRCIDETPIVNADESTVYNVLRDLVLSPARRREIGAQSREHAIKWWSSDVLAERYEKVWDHVRAYGRPPSEF